jgi:YD repeat-containing protein
MVSFIVPKKIAALQLALFFAFCTTCAAAGPYSQEQSERATTPSNGGHRDMSDRQKAGLHGPVHECTEQHTTPPVENFPGTSYSSKSTYDSDGKLLQTSMANSFGKDEQEFSTTYTYDSAGRLLKTTPTGSSAATDTNYTYDEKGRLLGISSGPGETSVFSYDDRGVRTRIMKSNASSALISSGTAYAFSVMEVEDPFLPIPPGGQVKTLFDDLARPAEWQVFNANANLTNRLIRSYDAQGRVLETSYTMENFALNLPPDFQQQLLAEPGAAEEMAKKLTKLLGSKREFTRMSYRYDEEGRLVEKRHKVGSTFMEMVTKTAYNEHSDKSEERTTTFGDPNPQNGGPDAPTAVASGTPSQDVLVRYSYEYDDVGNWTEQTISTQSAPGEPFLVSTVTRRTITYY